MIGADIGGTFTDLVYCDMESVALAIHKVSTEPDNPSRAILQGVAESPRRCGIREKGGKKLELQLINIAGFGFDQMTRLLQAQVKKAGLSVKITSESFPTLAATMNAGKQNLGDFFYFDLDGRDALYATLDSSQIKSGYNWAHYSNPKFDALLAKANSDSSGRAQAIEGAQKMAMDDAVFIPLYDLRQLWVTSKDVSGLKFTQSGYPLFYTTK